MISIKEIAEYLELTIWDWVAVLIALISLIVALFSLYVAKNTLKSQRKTEKNTLPLFTKEKQYEVLVSIIDSFVDNLIEAYVIKLKMQKNKRHIIPSELLFPSNFIDSRELHLELFYNEKEDTDQDRSEFLIMLKPSDYSLMSNLKKMIDTYNKNCNTIAHQAENQLLDYSTIKSEFDYFIIGEILLLLRYISYIASVVFKRGINKHIIEYVYKIMAEVVNEYEGKTTAIRWAGDEYSINIDEDRIEKVKKQMFKNIAGIDLLFNDTKEMWGNLFESYHFSYKLKNFEKEEINLDRFLDFMKICVVGKYQKIYLGTPIIKFKK